MDIKYEVEVKNPLMKPTGLIRILGNKELTTVAKDVENVLKKAIDNAII